MTAETPAASAKVLARDRSIRRGSLQGMAGPALALAYLLLTGSDPHRPVMTAIAGAVFALNVLSWAAASHIMGRRSPTPPLQLLSILANFAGASALMFLDGGIASPLGAMLPFSLLVLAVMVPPRTFVVVSFLSGLTYWAIALSAEPAPAGYAPMYTLMFAGIGWLCLRHAGALTSLRHRLVDVSRIDPLTRCLNRRGFDERLDQELAEAIRTGDPLTLVLADLDGFKEVNDTYGHRTGDELLAWTGRTLAEHLRKHDAVGRIGGDEFAVVLSDTSTDGGHATVERMREALRIGSPASFGYASYPADADTVEGLKHQADLRLYADKTSRDRRPPTAGAVAVAISKVSRTREARVSPRERRRRGIADMGRVGVYNNSLGIFYALVFAAGRPHRLVIIALLVAGLMSGSAVWASAARLSRWGGTRYFMVTHAVASFVIVTGAVVLDGGVHSPISLGFLAPMPLIALATPIRRTWPVLAAASGAYVGVGVTVGPIDGWYVALHLAGALVVSVVCGLTGRAAAEQRTLLHRLSRVDVLTDCLNRRGFEERFAAELAHAGRTSRPLSLVILDLDGFKQVNDRLGHAAGDELLSWVAGTLRRQLHLHDVVGRLGGDEFVVLLTTGSAADAEKITLQLQEALSERTAASAGVSVLGRDGQNFDELYTHADAALYAQKAGRRPGAANPDQVPRIPSPRRADETAVASGATTRPGSDDRPASAPGR
jgi:diguanylate cyclase (GGDEF)-like protein